MDLDGAHIDPGGETDMQSVNKWFRAPPLDGALSSGWGVLCIQQGPRQPQACPQGAQSPVEILSAEDF